MMKMTAEEWLDSPVSLQIYSTFTPSLRGQSLDWLGKVFSELGHDRWNSLFRNSLGKVTSVTDQTDSSCGFPTISETNPCLGISHYREGLVAADGGKGMMGCGDADREPFE